MANRKIIFGLALIAVAGCRSAAPELVQLPIPDANESVEFAAQPLPATLPAAAEVRSVAYLEMLDPLDNPNSLGEEINTPTPAGEQLPELTLNELEAIALSVHPAIGRATAKVQALRGKQRQVGLPPNPTVGYVGNEIGNEGSAGQQGGFVGQQFITGDKLQLSQQVVSQEIVRAEQQLATQQRRIQTDVRLGYYNVLIAQRKIAVAEELLEVNKAAVEASQELFDAKEISRAALLQTELELRNTQIVMRRAHNEENARWRQLESLLGEGIELAGRQLAGSLEELPDTLSWNQQLARLTTLSPEIAEAVAEMQRARRAVDRACAEAIPDVNTQLSVQFDDSTNDTVASVQVGIPLPIWNRNQGGIQQARAEVAAAQRNIERVEQDLKNRMAAAFQSYADAQYQVDHFSTKILPQARESLTLVGKGYRLGELGYLDLVTAQRTYSRTHLSYIDSLQNLWHSAVQIDGLLLEGSLNDVP